MNESVINRKLELAGVVAGTLHAGMQAHPNNSSLESRFNPDEPNL
jgi:hypothetical protein